LEKLILDDIREFISTNIIRFHQSRIARLEGIDLRGLLKKKNPYLFKAKNIHIASDLIKDILDAFLSSSEEKLFGDFLEELAIFIADRVYDGKKSAATGMDLEFVNEGAHYLVSIKSGPNWGNSAQHRKLQDDFQRATRVLKQSHSTRNVQPVLGICYGKVRESYGKGYRKLVGQQFWHFISGDRYLYTDIVVPLGHRAREHNDKFKRKKARVVNRFTKDFMLSFCTDDLIDWVKLVQFNSGNMQKGDLELS